MKLHRFGIIAALALGSLLACSNFSYAQDNGNQGKKKGGFSPQERVDRLATQLDLTADQKTKVKAIFEADQKKFQELRADTNLSREQRREKMQEIQKDSDKKLKEILKPDQWEKYEKNREQMRARGEGKKKKAE
jgi:periplasmic protein CpxP/Spy